jgi:hypothetical protein
MPDYRIVDVTPVDGKPVKLGFAVSPNGVAENGDCDRGDDASDVSASPYKVSLEDLKKFRRELDELSELDQASKRLAKIFVSREVARNAELKSNRAYALRPDHPWTMDMMTLIFFLLSSHFVMISNPFPISVVSFEYGWG